MSAGYRWNEFGKLRAEGLHGGIALGVGIERMVTGIKSPPDSPRGVRARLHYLDSPAGREAMLHAGITTNPRTVAAWTAGTRMPNQANRSRLDAAYWTLRRRNVAPSLKRRLATGRAGGGTRVEIDPVDQSRVSPRHRRSITQRDLTIRPRHWDTAVDAWLDEDDEALRNLWDEEITPGIGSQYDSYRYVSSVGWAF